ncbi:S8 family serine peptidase [Oceanobacillus sp. FSL H7-0719]|uniref:S8 family serine peptidase n=1 Tax=Oceanobacillus sp. FSL H7-0719 TaxID=2954507 RepID=UPI00324CD765
MGDDYLRIDELGKNYNLNGTGIKIGIIDIGTSKRIEVVKGINIIYKNSNYEDDHGHEAHIAGILKSSTFGVAGKSEIYVVKTLDKNMIGDIGNIVLGIDWLIKENADIILLLFWTLEGSNNLEEIINKADKIKYL